MKLILAEFNELSPVLMDKFIAAGKLPNFERLRGESEVYLTDAREEQENLEPWIQWITIHSGLSYAEHGIKNLGDGHKLTERNLWDLLSDDGKRVWVCGSMNINYRLPINGWVVPDPWMRSVKPHPEDELEPYYRFVSANVQEHTREDVPLSRREQLAFLSFMARHGLSPATVKAIVRQLVDERSSDVHWKRAVILDKLQFDLFRSHWKRQRPDFATFFLNSTAHFQHLYWRNMEPEHFKVKPEPGEQAVYEDAILYGYEQMDEIVGRLLRLIDDDTVLVFATALSQQPCLTYEESGGKTIYRPRDFEDFVRAVGIERPTEVAPVMAEEFHLDFETEELARAAEAKLMEVRYGDAPALGVRRRGTDLLCGCQIWQQLEPDAVLHLDGDERTVPFFDLFYKIDMVKSGMHHPDGMLWIRRPGRAHSEHPGKVPLTAIAPTILGFYGLEPPAYMQGEPVAERERLAG
jgi:Type I phosphodiesterase / nucleotide pyrophosphatase